MTNKLIWTLTTLKGTKMSKIQNIKEKLKNIIKNHGVEIGAFIFTCLFAHRCEQHFICNPKSSDSFNWPTGTCKRQYDEELSFKDIAKNVPVYNDIQHDDGPESWESMEVKKIMNKDGSYTVIVYAKTPAELPAYFKWMQVNRQITFDKARPTTGCIDLIPNDKGTELNCVIAIEKQNQH